MSWARRIERRAASPRPGGPGLVTSAAPDPIAARLLEMALGHGELLLRAARRTPRPLEELGFRMVFAQGRLTRCETMTRTAVLSLAQRLALDIPEGAPGFFPGLVLDTLRAEGCVCWFAPSQGDA